MKLTFDLNSMEDYLRFKAVRELPKVTRFIGSRTVEIPDEYADRLGITTPQRAIEAYTPPAWLFDYQRDIATLAIRKRKFAPFVDPGLGKTLIESEFARHAETQLAADRCVLMIAPPMVVPQTIAEIEKFYGAFLKVEHLRAKDLAFWLKSGSSRIGITNYEALNDETPQGRLGALVLDESSMLKSHYGKWGQTVIRLGQGLEWKMAATGTPAPNDRIEYANHAVFLDQNPTVNAFLARYFVNRGQTQNRWELKPHALVPFYRALSHWSIFLTNPSTYGWRDNAGTLPKINVHIHEVSLTAEQQIAVHETSGTLFGENPGGITKRTKLAQIAKGSYQGNSIDTSKPAYIKQLVESWPDESTIIWCLYDHEQEQMERTFPHAHSISGKTPFNKRLQMIDDFKSGRNKIVITKPKILGFGLNLQICTRQVFSGLQDSYESFYQCVKRSNRIGSTKPLNVHIPITSIERPMVETVLQKAKRVERDAAEQEQIFKSAVGSIHAA
jgi:hypothetical protein